MKKLLQILGGIPIVLFGWFAADIVGNNAEDIAWDTAGDIVRAIPIANDFLLNAALTEEAKKLNKNLPMMEDSETRWDSTIGINKQFRYNLTMINFLESEMDVPAFKQRMLPNLRNYVCTTKEMNFFVSNDVPVTYAYFDNEGKQFAIITIQPTDCSSSVPDLFIY